MTESDDVRDVQAVRSGRVRDFTKIVERWQERLVTLAYRFCRDRHRAEDMAQNAFLTAYRKLDQWRGEGPFRSWMFTLATNVYRSELRRLPVPFAELRGEPIDESALADEDPATIERLRRLVTAMPPKYRDVLVLYYFHDRDVTETATDLVLPVGTVKARLARGRELLRRALEEPAS